MRISSRKPRSELVPDGGGRAMIDEGPFVARVARDGKVTFQDRSSVGFKLNIPSRREIGQVLESWQKDPYGVAMRHEGRTPPIIDGRFELTDLAMRAAGQDPYAHRKMALLDRTRDERMQMAAAEKSDDLRAALARTPSHLEHIWRAPGTLAEKRRLLFQLWDECAESGSDEVLAASRAVRASIVAFIRRRLPTGSRAAYSERELTRLNARRTSRDRFEPY
jgi:hypothetical protein